MVPGYGSPRTRIQSPRVETLGPFPTLSLVPEKDGKRGLDNPKSFQVLGAEMGGRVILVEGLGRNWRYSHILLVTKASRLMPGTGLGTHTRDLESSLR